MDLFAQIRAEAGVTVVLVTHTTQLVSYGTRAIRMVEGRVVPSLPAAIELDAGG